MQPLQQFGQYTSCKSQTVPPQPPNFGGRIYSSRPPELVDLGGIPVFMQEVY